MKCPKCNSTRIVWYILVPTMSNNERNIGNCADCKSKITNKDYEVYRYAEQKRIEEERENNN